jgi:hypothetical protein
MLLGGWRSRAMPDGTARGRRWTGLPMPTVVCRRVIASALGAARTKRGAGRRLRRSCVTVPHRIRWCLNLTGRA